MASGGIERVRIFGFPYPTGIRISGELGCSSRFQLLERLMDWKLLSKINCGLSTVCSEPAGNK